MKNELTKNFIVEAKIAVLRPLAFHVSANVMPLATTLGLCHSLYRHSP